MRKTIVIIGVIIIVIGVVLFAYGFFFPPRDVVVDTEVTLKPEYYQAYWIQTEVGQSVLYSFSSSDSVEFVVFDSENFALWDAGSVCQEIHYFEGIKKSYSFHAPKTDKYYFVVTNWGEDDVTVSMILWGEKSYSRYIYIAGVGLSAVGIIITIAGIILKPKVVEEKVSVAEQNVPR